MFGGKITGLTDRGFFSLRRFRYGRSAFNSLGGFSFVFCLRSTIISSDVHLEVETRTVDKFQYSTVHQVVGVFFSLFKK